MTEEFAFLVTYSRRKTLALHVSPVGELEVRAPLGIPEEQITRFVTSKQQWIRRTRCKQQNKQKRLPLAQQPQQLFLGKAYDCRIHANSVRRDVFLDEDLAIYLLSRDAPDVADGLLKEWYRHQAKLFLPQRLVYWFEKMQTMDIFSADRQPPSYRIKALKSRWGSCSSRDNINLSLWLMRLPQNLLDYVLVHELCHLLEMNHSPAFHQWVAKVLPDWRQREQALKQF